MPKNILDTGARISYNYCGICGRVPGKLDEPNYAPLRWWSPDDGWKIGTLCRRDWNEVQDDRPKPGDVAYENQGIEEDGSLDEDVYPALDYMLGDE